MADESELRGRVGVVVIGRNEGERLLAGLDSIISLKENTVYVDSASKDTSVSEATARGIDIIELDSSAPLCAARARNSGFEFLTQEYPELEYVQFLDGDCELEQEWLTKAVDFMDDHLDVAAVCGRIRERNPQSSIYNFLCQKEWEAPSGNSKSCGGNSLMRVSAFLQGEGFRDDLIAGEEPELCFRLRESGWKIWRLAEDMVMHDANMTRFSQWWQRSVRSGYAFAQGMNMHGSTAELYRVRESIRIWFWGGVVPAFIVFGVALFGSVSLFLLAIYPLQVLKLVVKSGGFSKSNFIACFFLMLIKFPEFVGQIKYYFNRLMKVKTRLIEYK